MLRISCGRHSFMSAKPPNWPSWEDLELVKEKNKRDEQNNKGFIALDCIDNDIWIVSYLSVSPCFLLK